MILLLTSIKPSRKIYWITLAALCLCWRVCGVTGLAVAQVEFKPSRAQHSDTFDDGSGERSAKHYDEASEEDPSEKKKFSKAVNFSKFTTSMRLICSQLDEDGRREAMFKMLLPLPDELPRCSGCKSFLRSFAGVCKSARAKPVRKKVEKAVAKEPEGGAEPEPEQAPETEEGDQTEVVPTIAPAKLEKAGPPVRREPSTKLLDTVSTLMITLSEDELRSADAAQSIKALAEALNDPKDKTPGEREYFEILAAFMYAPFSRILHPDADPAKTPSAGSSHEKPAVDDLFTF